MGRCHASIPATSRRKPCPETCMRSTAFPADRSGPRPPPPNPTRSAPPSSACTRPWARGWPAILTACRDGCPPRAARYGELDLAVRETAQTLTALGVRGGDRVVLVTENSSRLRRAAAGAERHRRLVGAGQRPAVGARDCQYRRARRRARDLLSGQRFPRSREHGWRAARSGPMLRCGRTSASCCAQRHRRDGAVAEPVAAEARASRWPR